MSTPNKFHLGVLTRIADMGAPSSRWEVFGHAPMTKAGDVDTALHALVAAGLLVALPLAQTADAHGGTRFRVTTEGLRVLSRPVVAAKVANGKAKARARA